MSHRWAVAALTACLMVGPACSAPEGEEGSSRRPPSPSQSIDRVQQEADIRSMLRAIVRAEIAPGVVVLMRHGRDTRVIAAGQADIARGKPMTVEHRFRVGSITKSMVATVVLRLVQEGELSLDDTVGQLLPGLLPDGELITLKDLLSHTSGLPDYYDEVPAARPILRRAPVDHHALVVAAGRADSLFLPASAQDYSNTNYAVLGLVVEQVTGRSLEANLDRRIFEPAHMTAASLRMTRVREEPLAHGYLDGDDVTSRELSWAWAAGGVVSDAADVDRFFHALFAGELVDTEVVDEMAEPVADDLNVWSGYGLGLAEITNRCGKAVGHLGVVDGYASAAYTRRDADVAAVLLVTTNRNLHSGLLRDVLDTALCGP